MTLPTTKPSNPQYGSMGDFDNLMKTAKQQGIRVIMDMVMKPHLRPKPLVPGVAVIQGKLQTRLVHLA